DLRYCQIGIRRKTIARIRPRLHDLEVARRFRIIGWKDKVKASPVERRDRRAVTDHERPASEINGCGLDIKAQSVSTTWGQRHRDRNRHKPVVEYRRIC